MSYNKEEMGKHEIRRVLNFMTHPGSGYEKSQRFGCMASFIEYLSWLNKETADLYAEVITDELGPNALKEAQENYDYMH